MSERLVIGFDHIHLVAPPEKQDDARWFYGGVLGLREIPVPESVLADSAPIWFEVGGGQELHITFEAGPSNRAGAVYLALRVRSIRTLIEALKANGFEAWSDGMSGPEGSRCFCRDPFGNRLEFVDQSSLPAVGAA